MDKLVDIRVVNVSIQCANSRGDKGFYYLAVLRATITNPEFSNALCGITIGTLKFCNNMHNGQLIVGMYLSLNATLQHVCSVTVNGITLPDITLNLKLPSCSKIDVIWDGDIGTIIPIPIIDPKEAESDAVLTFDSCSFHPKVSIENNKLTMSPLRLTPPCKHLMEPYGCLNLVDKNLQTIRCFQVYSHRRGNAEGAVSNPNIFAPPNRPTTIANEYVFDPKQVLAQAAQAQRHSAHLAATIASSKRPRNDDSTNDDTPKPPTKKV